MTDAVEAPLELEGQAHLCRRIADADALGCRITQTVIFVDQRGAVRSVANFTAENDVLGDRIVYTRANRYAEQCHAG